MEYCSDLKIKFIYSKQCSDKYTIIAVLYQECIPNDPQKTNHNKTFLIILIGKQHNCLQNQKIKKKIEKINPNVA